MSDNNEFLNILDLSPFNSNNTSNNCSTTNFNVNTPSNYNIFNSDPNLTSFQDSFNQNSENNTDFNNNYITSSVSLDTLVLNSHHNQDNDNSTLEETKTLLAHSLTSNQFETQTETEKSEKIQFNSLDNFEIADLDFTYRNEKSQLEEKKIVSTTTFSDSSIIFNDHNNNNFIDNNKLPNQQQQLPFNSSNMNQSLSISLNENTFSYLDNHNTHQFAHDSCLTPSNAYLSASLNTPNQLCNSSSSSHNHCKQFNIGNHRSSLPISFKTTNSLTTTPNCQSNLLITLLTQDDEENSKNVNLANNKPNLNDLDEDNLKMQMSPSPKQAINDEDTTFELDELNLPAELVEETSNSSFNLMDSGKIKVIEQNLIETNKFENSASVINLIDKNINENTLKQDEIFSNTSNNKYINQESNNFFQSASFNNEVSSSNTRDSNIINNNNIIYSNQLNYMITSTTPYSTNISRSNSQPDLTINIEKLMAFPINYGSNHINGPINTGSHNNNNNNNNNSNNQFLNNNSNNQISSTQISNRYNQQLQTNHFHHQNYHQQMRRHPSLSYNKTSISECNEENEDFFTNFNIIDYLNTNNNNNNNNNNCNNSFKMSENSTNSLNLNDTNQSSLTLNNNDLNLSSSSVPSINTANYNNNVDDGLFLGIDAITDFLSKNGTCSDMFEDLPEIEDLMSLVTFETSSSASVSSAQSSIYNNLNNVGQFNNNNNNNTNQFQHQITHQHHHQQPQNQLLFKQQTQCDLDLNFGDLINRNPLSNFYDYTDMNSLILEKNATNNENINSNEIPNEQRITRSAPPSPTPQRKKQRPTASLPWHKSWSKMDDDERSRTIEFLTKIINDEMGLREQLEIIRTLNPDAKLKRTDTQFIIDLKMIDDDKFKRIKEVIKNYGLSLNEKQISDNSSDCSGNSCPIARREMRIKRAQQRLKLKQKKEQRQVVKESKSGLFSKTEVIPLTKVLPEEDIDIDILS